MNLTDRPRTVSGLLLVVFAFSAVPAAHAQGVQWRTDYNAARKEATDRGCPILIDFGTENCFYCKKLDATTFRDPATVAALNGQFVALKIDADREPALTQALRVKVYPTLVLASPDGKILGMIEGYLEPDRLAEHLARATAAVATPDWMARDFHEASRAVAAREYARAVTLLKGIGEDGKDRPVQRKAKATLAQFEQQAAGRLAHAKEMQDKGQPLEAVDTLTDLMRAYAGTQAAADAGGVLTALAAKPEVQTGQRERRARELLAQAREDYKAKMVLGCLERCETLVATYGDLPQGKEAEQLAGEIKGNPDLLAKACDNLSEKLGVMYVTLAEAHAKKGETKLAQVCLEKAMMANPGSPVAETAQVRLAQLQGRQTQTTGFVKP